MIAQPCARRAPAFVQSSRSAELLTSLAGGAVVQVKRRLVQFKTFLEAVFVIREGREVGNQLRIVQGVLDCGLRQIQAPVEGQMDVRFHGYLRVNEMTVAGTTTAGMRARRKAISFVVPPTGILSGLSAEFSPRPLIETKCPLKTTSGRLMATFDRWFVIFKRCNAANKGSCVAINRLGVMFKPSDVSVN